MDNKKIVLKQISSKNELDEIYAIRYKIYSEELGIIRSADFPDKKIKDEYDDIGKHFAAFIDNKVIGFIRVVHDNKKGLPLEKSYKNFKDYKKDKQDITEFTRYMIEPEYRKLMIGIGLMKLALLYSLSVKTKYIAGHVYVDDEYTPIDFLEKLGFKKICEPYMENRLYGYPHYITVIILDIHELFNNLQQKNEKYLQFSKLYGYKQNRPENYWKYYNIDYEKKKWSLEEVINYPVYNIL